tara:strand:- start:474 stop:5477 length:5004 start_codon:yes stop_codon:yes gene_type:complete
MSRKKTKNRKFLEEQVRKIFEQDNNIPIRGLTGWGMPKSKQNNTIDDTGWTDKQRMDYMTSGGTAKSAYHAAPAAKSLKTVQHTMNHSPEMSDEMYELIMTVFFGMKSSREQIMQLFGDDYKYGSGHALSNIHKSLDQVDGLTGFEMFVFRFLDLDFKAGQELPRIDLKWKSQIFKDISQIVNKYAKMIVRSHRFSGFYPKLAKRKYEEMFENFIDEAYEKVFVKYKLSDELDPVLSHPLLFGGKDPNVNEPSTVTFKPTEEFKQEGARNLVRYLIDGKIPDPDGEYTFSINQKSVGEFLEYRLTMLSYPLATGRNPEGEAITSFREMVNVARNLDIMGEPSSSKNLASKNRLLAAVAIREQSKANKRFVPLAIAFADVLLSIIGTASMLTGLAGFTVFLRNLGLRAWAIGGSQIRKKAVKKFIQKNAKSKPGAFVLGAAEFTAGLSVAFTQHVTNIENRFARINGLHQEFFSLLQQSKDKNNKELSYVKKNVDSGAYTSDQLGQTWDAVTGMFAKWTGSEPEKKLSPEMDVEQPETQKVSRQDLGKTLNKILVGNESTKVGFDLDSQMQDLKARSPFSGTSIMEGWRDVYRLLIDLQLSAVMGSTKDGGNERILSQVLDGQNQQVQDGYEAFMSNIEKLYRAAIESDEPLIEKQKIDKIYENFSNFVAIAIDHAKKLEQDSKRVKPLLNKMVKTAMPYDVAVKKNKKEKTNESIILEKTNNNMGGHTITAVKAPENFNPAFKNEKWVKLEHPDFGNEHFILAEDTANKFVKMRIAWASQAEAQVGKLIPSNTFRPIDPKAKTHSKNHPAGRALDLITPRNDPKKKNLFTEFVIFLGYKSGFKGFGFPQKTPCDNGDKCNTHIDTNEKRWWMYDNNGDQVNGEDRWIFRDAEKEFAEGILVNSKYFAALMKEYGFEAKHKEAIAKYNRKETPLEEIERIVRRKVREMGLEKPVEAVERITKKIAKPAGKIEKGVRLATKDIVDQAEKFAREYEKKTKFAKIDKVLDKEVIQKKYKQKIGSIGDIQDFEDLVINYTSNFGLSKSNVTARSNIVSDYASRMRNPNLRSFYINKKKEFERNILSRYKLKRLSRAKNKLDEGKVLSKQAIRKQANEYIKQYEENLKEIEKFYKQKDKFEVRSRYGSPISSVVDSPSIFIGWNPSDTLGKLLDAFEFMDLMIKDLKNNPNFKTHLDKVFEPKLRSASGNPYGPLDPLDFSKKSRLMTYAVDPSTAATWFAFKDGWFDTKIKNWTKKDPDRNAKNMGNLLRNKSLYTPEMFAERMNKVLKLALQAPVKEQLGHIEYSLVIEYIKEKGEEKKINSSITGPEILSAPESVGEKSYKMHFPVAKIILKKIQAKIVKYNFSNMKVSFVNTIASKPYKQKDGGYKVAYANGSYDSKTGIARLSFPLKVTGSKSDLKDFLKIKNPIGASDLKDTPNDRFAVFGLLGKLFPDSSSEMGSHRWFSHKRLKSASLNVVSSDTKATEFNPRTPQERFRNEPFPGAATADYFNLNDPYKVHEFMERDRIIQYIPTDMLQFSDESIYTVTYEIPGNGFDDFLEVNPTVVVGRKPFDKAAPAQRESDRSKLITVLKRNLDLFENYLSKLESLPSERIQIKRYTMQDYEAYKRYFESYISLLSAGISTIENPGQKDSQTILENSYFLNLMSAAMYNL